MTDVLARPASRLAKPAAALLMALALLAGACGQPTGTAAPAADTPPPQAQPPTADAAEPTPGAAPDAASWAVEVAQNGTTLPLENEAVRLARAPFTLRVRLPAPGPVKLNASTSDQNFQALQPGFVFTDDCLVALCTGMDVAEERLNPGQTLFVDVELTHYLYYACADDHRWSRADVSAEAAVFERDVALLNDIPVEQTAEPVLFLLFYYDQANPQQIDPGELKRIALLFQ
jgi:hypothetical protein